MAGMLVHHSYGKSRVRLTKVTRHADRHDLIELNVAVRLEGDFTASYTDGDNTRVVATDSMKNTVYVLARSHPLTDPESFGFTLAQHFLDRYSQVTRATVSLAQQLWQRIALDGSPHPHAFSGGSTEQRLATVTLTRTTRNIEAGLSGLLLLKTTDSAFTNFVRDEFTTLPDSTDRIFATILQAAWIYDRAPADWNAAFATVRKALIESFARHRSLAVQQTLWDMGQAALNACGEVGEVRLEMPNQHRIPVNLTPFHLDNPNVVFMPTDEPHGLITGTIRRE